MTQAAFIFSTNDASQRDRVLRLLNDGKPHTTLEFAALGVLRISARVHELRRAGYAIECRGARGRFEYRLTGRGAAVARCTLADLYAVDRLFRGAL